MKKKCVFIILLFNLIINIYGQNVSDFIINGNTLTRYRGSVKDVIIPTNLGITEIGQYAFYENSNITSVIIPEGVISIKSYVFYSCYNLTSISIPASVSIIENAAIMSCSRLISITVDAKNRAYSSEDGVLFNKDKTTLIEYPTGKQGAYIIPDGVISITSGAFFNCVYLTDLIIPASVSQISYNDFSNHNRFVSSKLSSISVDPQNIIYSSENGVLFNKDKTRLLKYPDGKQEITYIIPVSVTIIAGRAFERSESLINITIPASVNLIENSAFYGCRNLENVNIPLIVTSVEAEVFAFCSNIRNITIPEGVTSIGYRAFYGCSSLTSINIPVGITSIGNYAFYGCSSLTSINMPAGVTSIGNYAFGSCSSLASINIPAGVTSIGRGVFKYCNNLINITIPAGVTTIESDVFYGCSSLTNIIIPENVRTIKSSAFENAGLTSINILGNIRDISADSFSNNNITRITIISDLNWKIVEYISQNIFDSNFYKLYNVYENRGGTYEKRNNQYFLNEKLLTTPAALQLGDNAYIVSINGHSPSTYYAENKSKHIPPSKLNFPSRIKEFYRGVFYLVPGVHTIEVIYYRSTWNGYSFTDSMVWEQRYLFEGYTYNLSAVPNSDGKQVLFSIKRQ